MSEKNVVEVIKEGKVLLDEGFISQDEFSFLKHLYTSRFFVQNAFSAKPGRRNSASLVLCA